MRKSWLLAAVLVAMGMALPVRAQDTSKFNVYVGYDYVHFAVTNTSFLSGPFSLPPGFSTLNLNGGSAQAAYYLNSYLAVVGDLGGYAFSSTSVAQGNATYGPGSLISYMGGPRLSISRGKLSPFVQILLGASTLSPRIANKNGVLVNSGSDSEFSMTAGGGLDWAINRRFSIRPAQAEYYLTRFYTCTLGSTACTGIVRSQNNFRFSAGVVIRFGGK